MPIMLLTNRFFLSVESFCWLRVNLSGSFVSRGLLEVGFFFFLEEGIDVY